MLARGTWDAYRGFFPSPFRYYERAMETVESIVAQGVDTTQKMTRQGMGTAEKATHHERQTAHTATK